MVFVLFDHALCSCRDRLAFCIWQLLLSHTQEQTASTISIAKGIGSGQALPPDCRVEACAFLVLLRKIISATLQITQVAPAGYNSLWHALDELLMMPCNPKSNEAGIAHFLAYQIRVDLEAFHTQTFQQRHAAHGSSAACHHVSAPLTIAASRLFAGIVRCEARLPATTALFQSRGLVEQILSCVQQTRPEESLHQVKVIPADIAHVHIHYIHY